MSAAFEDRVIQEELEMLWGNPLTALTPKQRQMVVEILRQTRRIPQVKKDTNVVRDDLSDRAIVHYYFCF